MRDLILSCGNLSRIAAGLGKKLGLKDRLLMRYRPYICPFGLLAEHVPQGAKVLDIGCGNGLFLMLLASLNKIKSGTGIEITQDKIEQARSAAKEFKNLKFEYVPAEDEWPGGDFDCLTMIDVIHHVPPKAQEAFLKRVGRTGVKTVVFKDIDPDDKFRAMMNSLHDLVLARQLPHYCRRQTVMRQLESMGYRARHESSTKMLWYNHYLIVAERE